MKFRAFRMACVLAVSVIMSACATQKAATVAGQSEHIDLPSPLAHIQDERPADGSITAHYEWTFGLDAIRDQNLQSLRETHAKLLAQKTPLSEKQKVALADTEWRIAHIDAFSQLHEALNNSHGTLEFAFDFPEKKARLRELDERTSETLATGISDDNLLRHLHDTFLPERIQLVTPRHTLDTDVARHRTRKSAPTGKLAWEASLFLGSPTAIGTLCFNKTSHGAGYYEAEPCKNPARKVRFYLIPAPSGKGQVLQRMESWLGNDLMAETTWEYGPTTNFPVAFTDKTWVRLYNGDLKEQWSRHVTDIAVTIPLEDKDATFGIDED